ncbi:hypothetical protein ACFQE0_22345 [Methylobacterium komagatae]|uniref:Uncharacterized protein n=1 Tax=Methylobacterium komagatae TaxID=374425 RepID=A0ABW2BR57_9HYPH
MRIAAPALAVALLASPVLADEIGLVGEATIGSASRHVTLRLACDPAHAGLSAALTIPRFADLSSTFDVDAFTGASGTTKPLTAIRVVGANGVRSMIAPATGAVAADPATSFTLTVAGPKRTENPLRGIAPGFAQPGARIVWTQSSPRAGDASVIATFLVTDATAIRNVVEPCAAGSMP